VYTPYGKSFVLSSLSRIEQRLDPQQFFKASRADIIRISAITALEPGLAAGSMLAILQDGQQIDVSRRQVQQLKTLFGGF
jgi:two-component system LytT family response regulator